MTELREEVKGRREPNYEIAPLFLNRWSGRAMTGESLKPDEYLPVFEAARWAPSSRNEQPWRFVYVTRDDPEWDEALDILNDKNRTWAKDASLFVLVTSRRWFEDYDAESYTHTFDAGAAWQNLALEATRRGLVAHAMNGFDKEAALTFFDVQSVYRVETTIAIGPRASPETLPEDLQDREHPNQRRPLEEIVHERQFDEGHGTADGEIK